MTDRLQPGPGFGEHWNRLAAWIKLRQWLESSALALRSKEAENKAQRLIASTPLIEARHQVAEDAFRMCADDLERALEATKPPGHELIGIDLAAGKDFQVIRCNDCSFECDTMEQLVAHLREHGWNAVWIDGERL